MLYLVGSSVYSTHQDILKVGFCDSWKKRVPSYETNNKGFDLLGTREGDKALETTFHIIFHDHVCIRSGHVNSDEWFWYQKEIVKVFNEYSDDEIYELASSNRDKFVETMDKKLFRKPGPETRKKIVGRVYNPVLLKKYKLEFKEDWNSCAGTKLQGDVVCFEDFTKIHYSPRWSGVDSKFKLVETESLYLEILCDYFNYLKDVTKENSINFFLYNYSLPSPLYYSDYYRCSYYSRRLSRDLVYKLGVDQIKELKYDFNLCRKKYEEEKDKISPKY